MRLLFLGSPAFATIPLRALAQAGYEIVGVVTQPDRPAGRSGALQPPPVKRAALELGLPIIQPETLRDAAVVDQLVALRPDVALVAAYGEILRKKVLAIPPLGVLNIHPSLLPLHRGPTPVVGALLAGDSVTGVSIMLLDPGMDSGPLLAQRTVPLRGDELPVPLTEQLFHLGSDMLLDVLPAYAAGRLEPQPQDATRATVTRMLKKEDGAIDWAQPATMIERAIRAYTPWPGSVTTWRGQQFKVLAVRVVADWAGTALPGTLLEHAGEPLVATAQGALVLSEVQPAGKRPMDGRTWLRGQQSAIGQRFT